MNKINISAYQPILDIQDHIVFANNGNVVLCYEGNLPEIYSLSEKDFEDMHGAWFQALKSLPIGTVVHKQDIYLKKTYASEQLPNTTFLEKATHEHFKGRGHIEHKCYLFFILTKNKALNNPKYVNPFRKISKGIVQELDDNIKSFGNSVNDSVSFINNSRKIEFLPLKSEDIQQLTSSYFNGFNEDLIPIFYWKRKASILAKTILMRSPSTANYALAKTYKVAKPMKNLPQTILYFIKDLLMD
ncbi:conjugative transposon protein TraG [Algibacter lectus]|uniref:Conjugative transposon protein TraG n=1 Tax=Algibacter lectus TaxID=221126 RepID=A0A090W8C1_9FLAO|nr:conjugative transposon protein TraG [Algibacter lectus]